MNLLCHKLISPLLGGGPKVWSLGAKGPSIINPIVPGGCKER